MSKLAQVSAWLDSQKGDREQQHSEIHSSVDIDTMDDYELPDGSDSAESDSYEQNSLRTINDVKEFMISKQAWSSLREDFQGWLKVDKRHDGKDPSEKMQDEETEENQADCVISSPYNTELQGQKSLSYEPWTLLIWFTGHCRTYILKIMDFIEQFRRPLPPLGYKRITWRSACIIEFSTTLSMAKAFKTHECF